MITDCDLITEVCRDLINRAIRTEWEGLADEATLYRNQEAALRRLVVAPRKSGMEQQHENWVLAVLNWMNGHDIPMAGDIPEMLAAVTQRMAEQARQHTSLQRQLELAEEKLQQYQREEENETLIPSIEADLAQGAIGKAIGKAIDALQVARKQRTDLQLQLDSSYDASSPAFDEITKLCGLAQTWEYPGQVVRDVKDALAQRDATIAELQAKITEPQAGHKGIKATEAALHDGATPEMHEEPTGSHVEGGWFHCHKCGYRELSGWRVVSSGYRCSQCGE